MAARFFVYNLLVEVFNESRQEKGVVMKYKPDKYQDLDELYPCSSILVIAVVAILLGGLLLFGVI